MINEIRENRKAVCMDICGMIYNDMFYFNLVKGPLLHKVIKSTANYDKGFVRLSYHETIVSLVKKDEGTDMVELNKYKEWKSIA